MLTKETREKYEKWLGYPGLCDDMKKELESIKGNDDEIAFRFKDEMSFGTAGIRGIMSAGTSKINIYTIQRATQALADFILRQGGGEVAIAYDTRNNSELFAKRSAAVLAANGIKVHIFSLSCPTPELSFAVRRLKCIAGINITASHNQKQYNGYKVYYSDGAQIGPEQAEEISEIIDKTDIFEGVKTDSFDKLLSDGMISYIPRSLDDEYLDCVLKQTVNKNAIADQPDMAVVYTPLHGTGRILIPEVLKRAGLKNLITVPEQMIPDGNFPTVSHPNPEFAESFSLGIELAEKHGSDLIIATDPDADRMGVMVKKGDGSFVPLSGNQMGALLLEYIITAYKLCGGLDKDAYAVKSIVSTELASEICRVNGVKMYEVLTGFKYIGEVIKKHEEEGKGTYLLGFEESYGYLKGTYARDKDAVVASLLVCEMAAYYRSKGMTLYDAILEIYKKYGYYTEKTISFEVTGIDAAEKLEKLMIRLRNDIPKTIGSEKVTAVRDYLAGTRTETESGKVMPTGLPQSDVLYFELGGSAVVVRPSGTEPKVKIYVMMKGKTEEDAREKESSCEKDIVRMMGI